jgi:3-dehydroquinate synthase
MRYAIITDETVNELYGLQVSKQFQNAPVFTFPAGERFKTRETKQKLEDALLTAGYNRDTTLIALGGGVVTDLVGFLASTFCRGVNLILIPTTLLAMVDASIGGKTGVNTVYSKNTIGTFYEASQTMIDLNFLKTLPERELFNGYVEMWKAGLIADPDYFDHWDPLAIERARKIKTEIVQADPFDRGIRRTLNLGHTLGHAFETVSQYTLSHGEAVAAGIVLEAQLSVEIGLLSDEEFAKIKARFPKPQISLDPDAILHTLRLDKKGIFRFILLKAIGNPIECEVPETLIRKVLYTS